MTIIRNSKKPRGVVGVIAAVEGFGKTTTLGQLPGLYMLDVDDGSYGLDVPVISFDGTVSGMMALIHELKNDKAPADLENIGIDTADMLAQMLTTDLCNRKHWSSMEDLDYGKCWGAFKPEWEKILDGLKTVCRTKGINIIFTLHISGDKTFTEKTTGKQWNRWTARLTPKCAEKLFSFSDFYFTGIYDVDTMEIKTGRAKVNVAAEERRMIYTEHSSDHDGKCRMFIRMPDGSPMKKSLKLDEFKKALPGILDISTDKSAALGDFVEPKDDEPNTEAAKPSPKKEEPKKTEPAAEAAPSPAPAAESSERECVTKLREILKSYGVTDEQIAEYADTKLKERYGMSKETPIAEWPEDFVLWLCRGMDKIVVKIRK